MNVSELDLKQLLQQQVEKFRLMAQQKHIQLTIASCPDQLSVWMDANMADKIFENLLSNSIKYTHEDGTVTVKAWAEKGEIHITVADNGIGIPKNAQRHIFQNFYRAENAVNSKEAGSGLGLMLAERLIALHHGKLTFISHENKGTTFLIALKKGYGHLTEFLDKAGNDGSNKEEGSKTTDLASDNINETADDEKETILFIDDNDELRNYIQLTFKTTYNIVALESGEDAMEFLKHGVCDILISDVMMPGMSGTDLCKAIKENPETSWLPVILLTAKSGRDFVIEGLEQGADDYITKPFDEGVLKSKIDSVLINHRRLSKYYMERSLEMARQNETTITTDQQTDKDEDEYGLTLDENDRAFIEKVTQIVMDNLSDTEFNIDRLCREMAMSRTLFYGRLKKLTSKSPQDFIRIIRLERAASLIKEGKSVLDVSVSTGFVNVKHFSTTFKKHFGVSPSKYK